MKTFVASLFLASGAHALVARGGSCCFHLTGHGGHNGEVGQLSDGQNRIGGHLPEGTYCLGENGGITDGKGRGCILTAPTSQFQCDMGASPTTGFSVNCHGQLEYHGNTQFQACPTGDHGWNIYETAPSGQPKCRAVTLEADGCHKSCGHKKPPPKKCNKLSLKGNYQFPHLIVPISNVHRNKAYGTSYFGEASETMASFFNFDIPSSYAGKTCNLIFKLPAENRLKTSSYTISGSGGIYFSRRTRPATQSTTYNTMPGEVKNYGITNVEPGHNYLIHEFPCPAGKTIDFLMSSGGTNLRYFQDYNPPAIGLYITTC